MPATAAWPCPFSRSRRPSNQSSQTHPSESASRSGASFETKTAGPSSGSLQSRSARWAGRAFSAWCLGSRRSSHSYVHKRNSGSVSSSNMEFLFWEGSRAKANHANALDSHLLAILRVQSNQVQAVAAQGCRRSRLRQTPHAVPLRIGQQ